MKPYLRPGHRSDFRGHSRMGVGARKRQDLRLLYNNTRDGKVTVEEFLARVTAILENETNKRVDSYTSHTPAPPTGPLPPATTTLPTPTPEPVEITRTTPQ